MLSIEVKQSLGHIEHCVVCVCVVQSSPKQLAECVDLLLQLNEPAEELCEEFLAQ